MHWHYVPTLSNHADLVFRGVSPCRLLEKSLWWNGPLWLARPPDCWPPQTSRQKTDSLPDIKTALAVKAQLAQSFFWKRYSSWLHLIKIVSWIIRLIDRHCGKHPISNTLTATELRAVEIRLIKLIQQESYSSEMQQLARSKTLQSNSALLPLQPFIDSTGVLRVG